MTLHPREIRSGIKAILVHVLGLAVEPDEIEDGVILFDGRLGMNSVATIQILTAIEERFEIRFKDEEIGADLLRSVTSLAETVEQHLGLR